MTRSDLLSICAVLASALVMLGILGLLSRAIHGTEGLRKLAHVGTGLLALSFPWLFSSLKPVLVVCGLSMVMLMVVSMIPSIRSRLGAAFTRLIANRAASSISRSLSRCSSGLRAVTGCFM